MGQIGPGRMIIEYPSAVNLGMAPSGTTVISLAAGFDHTCAVFSNGKSSCWGGNSKGQLGIGNYTAFNVPVNVQMSGQKPWIEIFNSSFSSKDFHIS
jgi:alpha-tubulin suppressor-like RCC1 family protein